MSNNARRHHWLTAIGLLVGCAVYALIAIIAPETATALGVLYIAFLLTSTLVLRWGHRT